MTFWITRVGKLKNKIKSRSEKDWEEEMYTKSTLKWYRLEKDDTVVERCEDRVRSEVACSAGLLEDKRCRMGSDERCVIVELGRMWGI